jgi:hypothetical protein
LSLLPMRESVPMLVDAFPRNHEFWRGVHSDVFWEVGDSCPTTGSMGARGRC